MSKDNKDKEKYQVGFSGAEIWQETKTREISQEHPISSIDEPLIGWMVKPETQPMPEILLINGEVYQKIKTVRYAG